jgi:tRNA (guanine-N7-)-methyltransferase
MLEIIGAEPLRRYTASATREGYMPQPGYRPLNKSDNRDLAFGHAAWSFVLKRI